MSIVLPLFLCICCLHFKSSFSETVFAICFQVVGSLFKVTFTTNDSFSVDSRKMAGVREISGSHGDEYESGCLLGCCAM
jgi:hypothetical protein